MDSVNSFLILIWGKTGHIQLLQDKKELQEESNH